MEFEYDSPSATVPEVPTTYVESFDYYENYIFTPAYNFVYGSIYNWGDQMAEHNYSTFWMLLPSDSPPFEVGDSASVVSFSSLAAGDNTVQTITLGDNAVAAFAATFGAFALSAAAAI